MEPRTLARPPFLADRLSKSLQLLRHLLVGGHDLIESVGDLPFQSRPRTRQADREISIAHALQARENGRKTWTFVRGGRTVAAFCVGTRSGFNFCGRRGKALGISLHVRLLDT